MQDDPLARGAVTLDRRALSVLDLLIAGMSYMAPGFSLFFTTAVIASFAGVHIPLMYVFAGLGVLCTGAALSEFSRIAPSAGSLQVFIDRGFGRAASTAGGLILIAGYVLLQGAVSCLFGGWTASLLEEYVSLSFAWPILTLAGIGLCTYLMIIGVNVSIKATWVLFLIEFALVLIIALATIFQGGAVGLGGQPFSAESLAGLPLSAIAFGMVFATFSFVGFEGSISFAEETERPSRSLPIAVIGGIAVIALLYVLATYAVVVGFGADKMSDVAADGEPIATLARMYASPLVGVLKLAIWTSIVANLMAAGNANARILFNMGREQRVPEILGRVTRKGQTPVVAIVTFMGLTAAISALAAPFWDYLSAFGNIAGLGALLALLIYMTATMALPAYVRRSGQPLIQRPFAHLVIPAIGTAIWLIPLWGALQPGQPFPFNTYPAIAAGMIITAFLYAFLTQKGTIGKQII